MDKKFNDIHIVCGNDAYVIRHVTDISLQAKGCFIEITYRVSIVRTKIVEAMYQKVIVPSMEGLKIYID